MSTICLMLFLHTQIKLYIKMATVKKQPKKKPKNRQRHLQKKDAAVERKNNKGLTITLNFRHQIKFDACFFLKYFLKKNKFRTVKNSRTSEMLYLKAMRDVIKKNNC